MLAPLFCIQKAPISNIVSQAGNVVVCLRVPACTEDYLLQNVQTYFGAHLTSYSTENRMF